MLTVFGGIHGGTAASLFPDSSEGMFDKTKLVGAILVCKFVWECPQKCHPPRVLEAVDGVVVMLPMLGLLRGRCRLGRGRRLADVDDGLGAGPDGAPLLVRRPHLVDGRVRDQLRGEGASQTSSSNKAGLQQ